MTADRDPALVRAVADFIGHYREEGGEARRMQEAVLAQFGAASSTTYALALLIANGAAPAAGPCGGRT
ncbi:hypothetical protein [Phenylobacterium sp.]|uniref:hypothetical protein n=1 Tax=Phenylobacterium sp. TaxID=1871053 RepID=UPI0035B47869